MPLRISITCFVTLCSIRASNAIHPVSAIAKSKHNATGFLDLSMAEGLHTEEESLEGIGAIRKAAEIGGFFGLWLMFCCLYLMCSSVCSCLSGFSWYDKGHHATAMQEINEMAEKSMKELPENLQQHFKSPEFVKFCDKGLKDYYNKYVIESVKNVFGPSIAEDRFLVKTVTWGKNQGVMFETEGDVRSIYKYCEITLYKKEKRMISLKIDQ